VLASLNEAHAPVNAADHDAHYPLLIKKSAISSNNITAASYMICGSMKTWHLTAVCVKSGPIIADDHHLDRNTGKKCHAESVSAADIEAEDDTVFAHLAIIELVRAQDGAEQR
jgi:hypothetical protein